MQHWRAAARAFNSVFVLLAASACSGLVIHNESRSKLAADGKQHYEDAKVLETLEAERKNFATLLAAEIEAARENYRYQLDYALLGMANNPTPMADTWSAGLARAKALGFDSLADLRALERSGAGLRAAERTNGTARGVLLRLGVDFPECSGTLPAALTLPADADEATKTRARAAYELYKKSCETLQKPPALKGGEMLAAYREWQAAKAAVGKADKEQQLAKKAFAQAKKDYEEAVKAGADPKKRANEREKDFQEKAGKLASALERVRNLGDGLRNEENIEAIVEILSAAAGGDVNPEDPTIKRAAIVAKEIPSLAIDIGALQAARKAPPVSGLLIALRHHTLLAQAAKKRIALAEERVEILETRYGAFVEEASRWREFLDAVCSYAVQGAGLRHPGRNCDNFVVTRTQDGEQDNVSCAFGGRPVQDCLLQQPWKSRLRAQERDPAPGVPPVKRELYKAIAAYLQARGTQVRPIEQRYREIDVRHRETLLAKQTALEAWDNLVAVPLEQLDGYYKAGLKPTEVADLLVKAIGFTAVGIGLAQR